MLNCEGDTQDRHLPYLWLDQGVWFCFPLQNCIRLNNSIEKSNGNVTNIAVAYYFIIVIIELHMWRLYSLEFKLLDDKVYLHCTIAHTHWSTPQDTNTHTQTHWRYIVFFLPSHIDYLKTYCTHIFLNMFCYTPT